MHLKYFFLLFFTGTAASLFSQIDFQKELQAQFNWVENGDTIEIPAGTYSLLKPLWLDGKRNVAVRGAGKDSTILSYHGQTQGGQAIKITHSIGIRLQDFSIQDAKGDGIEALNVDGLTFYNIKIGWSNKWTKKEGVCGIFPLLSKNILLDSCEISSAADAGICVSQSDNFILRNCILNGNVVGVEIKNATNGDVFQNQISENAAGILIIDLPGMAKKGGGKIRVFDNEIKANNARNFALPEYPASLVPAGTGIQLLAAKRVEVFENQIVDNRTAGAAIFSYFMVKDSINDGEYDPFPDSIYLHHNHFSKGKKMPRLDNKIGWTYFLKFGKKVPDILFDGILKADSLRDEVLLSVDYPICLHENEGATFANLDAGHLYEKLSRDSVPFNCIGEKLKPVKLKR